MLLRLSYFIRMSLALLWFFLVSLAIFVIALFRFLIFRVKDASLNRTYCRWLAKVILPLAKIRVRVEGLENITDEAVICVANHQSAIDIPTLGSICPPRTIAIAKKELGMIPIFNLFFIATGNIYIDRGKREAAYQSLKRATEIIKEKRLAIWMFPEGTRNRAAEGLLPFKKGAFTLAVRGQVPLLPYVCSPLKNVFHFGESKMRGGEIRIRVLPPIPTVGLKESDVPELTQKVREMMLAALETMH